jgi:antitoxin component of MazEF toxin-antitoxin module
MNIICINMPDITQIKRFGSSIGIALSRPVLEKVYGLSIGSDVEIDYSNPPIITIKPVRKKGKEKTQ